MLCSDVAVMFCPHTFDHIVHSSVGKGESQHDWDRITEMCTFNTTNDFSLQVQYLTNDDIPSPLIVSIYNAATSRTEPESYSMSLHIYPLAGSGEDSMLSYGPLEYLADHLV